MLQKLNGFSSVVCLKNIGTLYFVHPIFLSFGFWYFGHFSFVFFRLAHLALQNVNKDYVIFSYFLNFVAKSHQKPKTKNGMNETNGCIFVKSLLMMFSIYQVKSKIVWHCKRKQTLSWPT